MTLVRWDPFRALRAMERDFSRLFFNDARARSDVGTGGPTWTPNADIYDRDDHVELAMELPGVDISKVEINLDGDVLTVRGERQPVDLQPEKVFFSEGVYGPFYRAFTLPQTIQRDGIKAEYKDGILTVKLPRAEEAKPRQIPLNAAA